MLGAMAGGVCALVFMLPVVQHLVVFLDILVVACEPRGWACGCVCVFALGPVNGQVCEPIGSFFLTQRANP